MFWQQFTHVENIQCTFTDLCCYASISMYRTVSSFCIINKQCVDVCAHMEGPSFIPLHLLALLHLYFNTKLSNTKSSLSSKQRWLDSEWHRSLLTSRKRKQTNLGSFVQLKGGMGDQVCICVRVQVLWVNACAQRLGESFKRAWMSSAWQELTPERNTCLHVCVLHECIFMCSSCECCHRWVRTRALRHVSLFTLEVGITCACLFA